jgi:hypothetical protein
MLPKQSGKNASSPLVTGAAQRPPAKAGIDEDEWQIAGRPRRNQRRKPLTMHTMMPTAASPMMIPSCQHMPIG